MEYEVNVIESATYEVHVRIAGGISGGQFHLEMDGSPVTLVQEVPNTGGYQSWQTMILEDVILHPSDNKLRFYADNLGFNLASFEFIPIGSTSAITTDYFTAFTLDENTVQLSLNKPLTAPIPASPADFIIWVNGMSVAITDAVLNEDNTRIITFTTDHTFASGETISISYTGEDIYAEDGTALNNFNVRPVINTIANIHIVPGKIEAEDYFQQVGIELEICTDVGEGLNLSYLDGGDYADYMVNVAEAGIYRIDYRTAAQSETGQIQLQKVEANGEVEPLHNVNFAPTGGWQTWATTSQNVLLEAGEQHFRIEIINPLFNINWLEFFPNFPLGIEDNRSFINVQIVPNPNTGIFALQGVLENRQEMELLVVNLLGQTVLREQLFAERNLYKSIDLSDMPEGNYVVHLQLADGSSYREQFVKTK